MKVEWDWETVDLGTGQLVRGKGAEGVQVWGWLLRGASVPLVIDVKSIPPGGLRSSDTGTSDGAGDIHERGPSYTLPLLDGPTECFVFLRGEARDEVEKLLGFSKRCDATPHHGQGTTHMDSADSTTPTRKRRGKGRASEATVDVK